MKNMKVSVKLIVSFTIVALLAAIVGVVGIIGMLQLNEQDTRMYEVQLVPLPQMAKVIESLQRMRVNLREYALGAYAGDMARVDDAAGKITNHMAALEENMTLFGSTIENPEIRRIFDEARQKYNQQFVPVLETARQAALSLNPEGVMAELEGATAVTNEIVADLGQIMTQKTADAASASASNSKLSETMLVVIICVLIAAVLISMFLALYISGLISKPLRDMMGYIKQAGETGNLHFHEDEWKNCDRLALGRDEIGQTMKAFTVMMRKFVYYGELVNQVAAKDLTVTVNTLGANDTFGNAIRGMVSDLSGIFGEIKAATAQVATGSTQIADGAQALAQGSTEQSATVEELSATIAEIASKTRDNAEMADSAAKLAHTIMGNAEKGSRQMDEMTNAVSDINQASQSISRVIKVIDDIAFQTNILALNAAVEAARAGQHGKGFAVVADEVRNLAAKSAEAAKNTGELISNSMEKAELGAKIAADTAASLVEIVSGIKESNQIVDKIAVSSEEQNVGIRQINEGIDQVAQVVQQNSATAEQSAASAEELSSQSVMLEQLIAQFRLKEQSAGGFSGTRGVESSSYDSSSEISAFALEHGSTGKY